MGIKLYTTCEDIPIYNFYKANYFGELEYLIVDESKRKEKVDGLGELLDKMVVESWVLANSKENIRLQKSGFNLMELEYKYNGIVSILKMFQTSENEKILETLKLFGVKYNGDIDFVFSKLKHLKNKINISRINFKNGIPEVQDTSKIIADLDKEALVFEDILNLGYYINKKEVSVERWLMMRNLAKEKISRYGEN